MLVSVVLPVLRTSVLNAAFLTVALVLGEFTFANILGFETFPTWIVRIAGSHFLWKMVRRMVGVLGAVGTGDLQAGDVARLMSGEGGDYVARVTAPAAGLFLERVSYPGDAPPLPIAASALSAV